MSALARSVIEAALFLESSGDDVVDPDSAVKALETIAHELQGTGDTERLARREALDEWIEEDRSRASGSASRPEVIEFYRTSMEDMGLEGG
jgi:hypothetical protein